MPVPFSFECSYAVIDVISGQAGVMTLILVWTVDSYSGPVQTDSGAGASKGDGISWLTTARSSELRQVREQVLASCRKPYAYSEVLLCFCGKVQ